MVKRLFYDKQKMLNVLIATGILILVSIIVTGITGNAKFMGIGLTLFFLSVFWNMRLIFLDRNITIRDFVNQVQERENEAEKKNNHFLRATYLIVIPMMGVGILFVLLILVEFFTIL